MNKQAVVLASVLILASSSTWADNNWTWLAAGKEGYQTKPAISLLLGQIYPNGELENDTIGGLEFSLNSALLQPPSNRIRQQFSFSRAEENGVKISTLEMNPHYLVEVIPGFELGGGPGLGYVVVDRATGDGGVFALQLGLSMLYEGSSPLYLGAEMRYQFTAKDNFGTATKTDANNFRFAFKVGFSF